MNGMLILDALTWVPEELLAEAANEAFARTAGRGYRKRTHRLVLVAVLTALTLLTLIGCGAYQYIQRIQYMPIDNSNVFSYRAQKGETPEDAAMALAEMYIENLMIPSEEREFYITRYRNLSVTLHPTKELWEIPDGYFKWDITREEVGQNKWIVEIHVEYQYEGSMHVFGECPEDRWETQLYQSSQVDFLLVKHWWGEYTLQSRMYIFYPSE